MNAHLVSAVVLGSLVLSACTPMGAVSIVGSTLSRTIEKQQEKKAKEPINHRIAVTNVNVGVQYMRRGNYERALAKFEKALEADPKYPLTYNMLGVLHQMMEQPEEAEEYFIRSLELDPEDSSALNNYGQFLCKQERLKEADEKFLAAAHNPLYSTPELAYTNAGSCAYLHKQTKTAETYFHKALSINPKMPVALSQMAEISFERGEYATARDYLNRYLEIASHTPKTLWLGIRIERQFDDVDRLASYSLLLRNKYPDTREAELLRISEEYVSSVKSQRPSSADRPAAAAEAVGEVVSRGPARQNQTAFLPDSSGLLGEADLAFSPLLLKEKELLGME